MKEKVFSFDAETNGLWGEAFALAAVVVDQKGNELDKFIGRCPIDGEVDSWVKENVLPAIETIKEDYSDYKSLLSAFMNFYLKHTKTCKIIVHMGLPVEARLFLDAHKFGIIGDWDAPYPLIDIAAFPQINDSVDTYNKNNSITIPNCNGGTHNPLFDSYAAAYAYLDIIKHMNIN